ncbi:MAG TPA: glycosyltransferase [Candidatus Paceibacterota bacterium]|nr:glycosyltransferase [Candidatus Paceibacterota bacterium]
MNHDTTVTAVIATYNSAPTIIQSVESVLNQTFKQIEIIVVDDGSTDTTRAILEPYIAQKKIVYLWQENKGCGAARNRAVQLAHGEFVAFLDADDYWHPEKIEKQIILLKKYRKYVLCYTDTYLFDEHHTPYVPPHAWCNRPRSGNNSLSLLSQNILTLSSVVMPTAVFRKLHGFVEEHKAMMFADYDLWLRAVFVGPFYAIEEPLVFYRVHPQSSEKIKSNFFEILQLFKREFRQSKTIKEKIYYAVGYSITWIKYTRAGLIARA